VSLIVSCGVTINVIGWNNEMKNEKENEIFKFKMTAITFVLKYLVNISVECVSRSLNQEKTFLLFATEKLQVMSR
jgi:hypothetical protein